MGVYYRVIGKNDVGQRIDNYLLSLLRNVPKSRIYRAIRSGEVRVNKGRVRAEYRLAFDDRVRIPPLKVEERKVSSSHVRSLNDACVLYEDESYCVIDKPAGVPVHSGSGHDVGVIDMMKASGRGVLYLAHRLDKEVSGCLLFCKSRETMISVQSIWCTNDVCKSYRAIVFSSEIKWEEMLVDMPLSNKAGGCDAAVSQVKVLSQSQGYALVQVEIETGRKHQIRRHLSMIGLPIVGDTKYGDFEANRHVMKSLGEGAPCLMLTARELSVQNLGVIHFCAKAQHPSHFERMLALAGLVF